MMIRKEDWSDAGRQQKAALVEQAYGSSPFLYVTTEILIHDLTVEAADALARSLAGEDMTESPDAPPCPCCGSRTARIVERRPDVALFINRDTGKRVLASKLTPAERATVVADSEHVAIVFRVSRAQLPLLFAPRSKHVLASGSHRSGKTQIAGYWLTRQWLLYGGRRAQFWIVAPTHDDAKRVLEKMVHGDDKAPSILPVALFKSLPHGRTHHARMADGSIIDLKHLQENRAGNLKRESVQAILVDEAAEIKADQLSTLTGRVLMTKGSLFLATTPTHGSLLKPAIVDKCHAYANLSTEAAAAARHHVGRRWLLASLQIRGDQPWADPVHIHNEIMTRGGEDDPSVRRDFFGEWVSNAGPLWREFSLVENVMRNECREVAELAEWRDSDVTPIVVSQLFGRPNLAYRSMRATNKTWLAGMDVNIHPHSTVILQVACDRREPTNKDLWTVIVWDCIQTQHGNSYKHAEALNSHAFARVMRPDAKGAPYKGIGVIVDATSLGRDPTAHTFQGDPKGLAEVFGKAGIDVRPPLYGHKGKPAPAPKKDSYLLLARLIREGRLLVHERCQQSVITALLGQEDSGDGQTPIKVSGNASDRLSSSIDALRYVCWAIFHGGEESTELVSDTEGWLA